MSAATPSSVVTIEPNGSALTFRSSIAGPITVNVTVKDPGGLDDIRAVDVRRPTARQRSADGENVNER